VLCQVSSEAVALCQIIGPGSDNRHEPTRLSRNKVGCVRMEVQRTPNACSAFFALSFRRVKFPLALPVPCRFGRL